MTSFRSLQALSHEVVLRVEDFYLSGQNSQNCIMDGFTFLHRHGFRSMSMNDCMNVSEAISLLAATGNDEPLIEAIAEMTLSESIARWGVTGNPILDFHRAGVIADIQRMKWLYHESESQL
jgi:hypothetical protein